MNKKKKSLTDHVIRQAREDSPEEAAGRSRNLELFLSDPALVLIHIQMRGFAHGQL